MKKSLQIMQKIFLLMLLLTSLGIITSCDDYEEDNLGTLEIEIVLPKGAKLAKKDLKISLINSVDNNKSFALTNNEGIAKMPNLPEGTYSASIDTKIGEINVTGSISEILVTKHQTTKIKLSLKLGSEDLGLVIKQIYYSGSDENTFSVMFKDQFIQLHNNSTNTIYADGLLIANLYGTTINDGHTSAIVAGQYDINKKVYADWVIQIPGQGQEHPIEPGKNITIAFNAIDFTKEVNAKPTDYTILNLANADFETYATPYLEANGKTGFFFDQDNPDVPNVEIKFLSSDACYWDQTGSSAIIFRSSKEFTNADIVNFTQKDITKQLLGIDVNYIIDGVDFLGGAKSEAYKRLPISIDNSFYYLFPEGDNSLTGKGLHRKTNQELSNKLGITVYKDTNNSSLDFDVIKPNV